MNNVRHLKQNKSKKKCVKIEVLLCFAFSIMLISGEFYADFSERGESHTHKEKLKMC